MNTRPSAPNVFRKPSPSHRPSRPTRTAPQTFILDTNILHLWVMEMTGTPPPSSFDHIRAQKEHEKRARAKSFCESACSQRLFVIPPVVWVELYGVLLQKDIDVSNYVHWRRLRKAALQPLESMIGMSGTFFSIGEEELDHERAVEMCRAEASAELLAAWSERVGRTYDDGRPVVIKGLDGIDAAILSYAWSYAEAHPDREVRLVSDDHGLGLMVQELHRSPSLAGEEMPPNLGFRSLWGKRFPETLSFHPPSTPPTATSTKDVVSPTSTATSSQGSTIPPKNAVSPKDAASPTPTATSTKDAASPTTTATSTKDAISPTPIATSAKDAVSPTSTAASSPSPVSLPSPAVANSDTANTLAQTASTVSEKP
ncbi:hypothetical protein L6R29_09190 [Myxococcota bacterium]|nr:hypothetical protein [Myxococcota bacterium]